IRNSSFVIPNFIWPLESTVIGHHRLVPKDIVVKHGAPANVAVAAQNRLAHDRILADPRIRPHNGALDNRMLLDVALTANDAIGTDPGARLDDRPLVDEARPFQHGALVDS